MDYGHCIMVIVGAICKMFLPLWIAQQMDLAWYY